jgi:hypothetical protein
MYFNFLNNINVLFPFTYNIFSFVLICYKTHCISYHVVEILWSYHKFIKFVFCLLFSFMAGPSQIIKLPAICY